jgi:hypothetical protein
MTKTRSIILWVFSFLFMAGIAVYQRMTGPTYPIGGTVTVGETKIDYKLPTSHDADGAGLIKIEAPDKKITARMKQRRYKSMDEWEYSVLRRSGDYLYGDIPQQPPAGKVMYQVFISNDDLKFKPLTEEPVIIRFKGYVPLYFLIPHIILMFSAMWFSTRTGLDAIFKGPNTAKLSKWTVILFAGGGLLLGPVIQYYAFGAFWTGWPFGHDLTDNKTIVAFLLWLVAWWQLRKNPQKRIWALLAAIILLGVYLIPHSVLGSELDHTKLQAPPPGMHP